MTTVLETADLVVNLAGAWKTREPSHIADALRPLLVDKQTSADALLVAVGLLAGSLSERAVA